MKHSSSKVSLFSGILFAAYALAGCSKKDVLTEAAAPTPSVKEAVALEAPVVTNDALMSTTATTSISPFNLSVSYAGRGTLPYGYTQAVTDYRSVNYWSGARTAINNGNLTTTLAANMVGPTGGTVARMAIPNGTSYSMSFDMMFDPNFDFSYGGKVGFGFLIGAGYTGGTPGWDGNGGSARIMWYKSGGRVYLKPYIYYRDQPTKYGNDFGRSYPSTGSIERGRWHNVKIAVRSNTGSIANGYIHIQVNGIVILSQGIRWTTNDTQRMIKNIVFETFRGGAESYWQSTSNGRIHFNNFRVVVN